MTSEAHYRTDPIAGATALVQWLSNPVSLEGASKVPKMKMAMGGPEYHRRVRDMRGHPDGRRILADRPDLGAALASPDLRQMEEGSLGRLYYDDANFEGAVPGYLLAGLVHRGDTFERLEWDEDMKYLLHRLNNTHDLLHQLSGYGTDLAGEALNISFTLGMESLDAAKSRVLARVWTGIAWLMMMPSVGVGPFGRFSMEAFERGRRAAETCAIHNVYFEEMLPRSRDEVRAELGVGPTREPVDTATWELSPLGRAIARGYRKAEDDGAERLRWMDRVVQAGVPVKTLVNLDEDALGSLLERAERGDPAEALCEAAGLEGVRPTG